MSASESLILLEQETKPTEISRIKVTLPRLSLYATGAVFAASDTLSLIIAAFIAHIIWIFFNPGAPGLQDFLPALPFFWAMFWIKGLYPGVGMTPVEQLRSLVKSIALIYLILISMIFLMKEGATYSRAVFSFAGMLSVILVPISRALACRIFSNRVWWGTPVLILGAGQTARLLIRELNSKKSIGFKPIACLDDDPTKLGECEGVPVVGQLQHAAELAKSFHINSVILAMPGISRDSVLALIEQCSRSFARVILIPDLFGLSSLWVSALDLNGTIGLQLKNNLLVPLNRYVKRAMDVIISALSLILAAPLILICGAWIKIVSPGKAFYFQDREGLGNKTIRIRKLRTMYPNADQMLIDYLRLNASAQLEWDTHCKLKNDPRVLPVVGRFLRRTSFDELPQLWNVLKGEMSLVGPRPFPDYHTAKFDIKFRALRRKVMPGLTGLWQISERSEADIKMQQRLDTYYINNWSIWLDLYILSRTALAVIAGNGAY
jgi:Undecaprenyl-phosphate galactose phosphotransferase WbaP